MGINIEVKHKNGLTVGDLKVGDVFKVIHEPFPTDLTSIDDTFIVMKQDLRGAFKVYCYSLDSNSQIPVSNDLKVIKYNGKLILEEVR